MRLLIYKWNSYSDHDVEAIFREKNISFTNFTWNFKTKNEDSEFEKWFSDNVDSRKYDALFSIDYWPLLSKMCQIKNLKYIVWSYDTPPNVLRIEETLGNPVNYVFWFDRMQYSQYKNMGFDTVYHLPLGVNSTRMRKLKVTPYLQSKYTSDVSLVGKLYDSHILEYMAYMNEYTKGYLRALMDAQSNIYGYYMFDDLITDELMEDINNQYKEKSPDTEFVLPKEALTFAMASEVTRRERVILLELCGKRFDTRLYSYQNSEVLKNAKLLPAVDYINEMPYIFACSKINLNPSFRIIQTGIPLRALDIMGAGGFLLSNYQEELVELYDNNREMVIYENIYDAIDKIAFYLKHEELRRQIAQRGREKTLQENSMQKRFEKIFEIVLK